jgi:hypothetical protein
MARQRRSYRPKDPGEGREVSDDTGQSVPPLDPEARKILAEVTDMWAALYGSPWDAAIEEHVTPKFFDLWKRALNYLSKTEVLG